MRLGVNHALERSYYFLLASGRAKLFLSFPLLLVQDGASSPRTGKEAAGAADPLAGHPPSPRQAGSPRQSGCLQACSRPQHSQAHLCSGTEQRLGPHRPSRTGWDAGVPSCSVQGYGVAMLPQLDPDPLLVRTAQGQGHCHGSVAQWDSSGGPAGPCLGAPMMLQLAALAVLGLFSP